MVTFVTSAKEGLWQPAFVWLIICEQNNSKSYEEIFRKFSGNVDIGPSSKRQVDYFSPENNNLLSSQPKEQQVELVLLMMFFLCSGLVGGGFQTWSSPRSCSWSLQLSSAVLARSQRAPSSW